MTELLPCPFCGKHATFRVVRDKNRLMPRNDNGLPKFGYTYKVRCECSYCHSLGKTVRIDIVFGHRLKGIKSGYYKYGSMQCVDDAVDKAIAAWNTRAERTCENVDKFASDGFFICGNCGFGDNAIELTPNYCPNCGAKVVGE